MSHVPFSDWHALETEERRIEITVTSSLQSTDIVDADLRINGLPVFTSTPQANVGGYKLVLDPFVVPPADNYFWQALVTDDDGNGPLEVAKGCLHVDRLIPVAP